jgi:hypothetical protein
MQSQAHDKSKNPREVLAQLIDQHGEEVLELVVAALLDGPWGPSGADAERSPKPAPDPGHGRLEPWRENAVIEDFVAHWPEGNEHYGPMTVYETRDHHGTVRLAIGQPHSRLPLYGAERGWVSIWHVANGRPVQQLANFIETDDFKETGARAALISGKDGARKKGFAPGEESLLPPVYSEMRIETHRDRLNGPMARNRLVVIATERDTDAMLDHALAHLHLRSSPPA